MSASSWQKRPESQYLLDEPHTTDPFSPPNGLDLLETQALLSSDEDEDDDALSLPSAGVANVRGDRDEVEEGEGPDIDIGQFDWGKADEEVEEFLAELGDDGAYSDSDNER